MNGFTHTHSMRIEKVAFILLSFILTYVSNISTIQLLHARFNKWCDDSIKRYYITTIDKQIDLPIGIN